MREEATGRTRLKPIRIGIWPFRRTILMHQTEIEYDHMWNAGGMVEIDREKGWFTTRPEWLMEQDDDTRGN